MTGSPYLRLAVACALAAALLAGCGRKGPLDPPPGAWVTPVGTRAIPAGQVQAAPEYDENGNAIAPSGPKRRLPGDWLID